MLPNPDFVSGNREEDRNLQIHTGGDWLPLGVSILRRDIRECVEAERSNNSNLNCNYNGQTHRENDPPQNEPTDKNRRSRVSQLTISIGPAIGGLAKGSACAYVLDRFEGLSGNGQEGLTVNKERQSKTSGRSRSRKKQVNMVQHGKTFMKKSSQNNYPSRAIQLHSLSVIELSIMTKGRRE
jgi:hypothetical protein